MRSGGHWTEKNIDLSSNCYEWPVCVRVRSPSELALSVKPEIQPKRSPNENEWNLPS